VTTPSGADACVRALNPYIMQPHNKKKKKNTEPEGIETGRGWEGETKADREGRTDRDGSGATLASSEKKQRTAVRWGGNKKPQEGVKAKRWGG